MLNQDWFTGKTLFYVRANNLGFALQQLGRYDESIANFRNALTIAETLKSPILEDTSAAG